jgi:hypothetical protein
MTARIQLQKKKKNRSGHEPQGAWRQDEMIGGESLVIK